MLTARVRHRMGQVTGRDTGYWGGGLGKAAELGGCPMLLLPAEPGWGGTGEGLRRGWDPSLPTSLGGTGPALARRGSPAQHPADLALAGSWPGLSGVVIPVSMGLPAAPGSHPER